MPYILHGVCIHEGSVDSGHYYSYIKDHTQQVWRHYNDHIVSVVNEERVLEDANGGISSRSAYYVIYISEQEMLSIKTYDVNRHEPSQAALFDIRF